MATKKKTSRFTATILVTALVEIELPSAISFDDAVTLAGDQKADKLFHPDVEVQDVNLKISGIDDIETWDKFDQ